MVNDNCKMSEEELERALKCDAAVPPEHRGITFPSVAASIPPNLLDYTASGSGHEHSAKEQPVFGHEQAEALFANLVDRVVALEAEVAALKAAKV